MKNPGMMVPLLTYALTAPEKRQSQKAAARVLGISGAMYSKIRNAEVGFPLERKELAVRWLNETYPTLEMTVKSFDMDEADFVDLFKNENIYKRLRGILGSTQEEEVDVSALKHLFGSYWRLYICRDPDELQESAVALDYIEIRPGRSSGEFEVLHADYEHEAVKPRGFGRIASDDTMYFAIDYKNPAHPPGYFMGPKPVGNPVGAFMMATLDVKWKWRDTVSRPMLFVRAEGGQFDHDGSFSASEPLYAAVQEFMGKYVTVDVERRETLPSRSIQVDDILRLSDLIESLRSAE
jgi:hypothetical protein